MPAGRPPLLPRVAALLAPSDAPGRCPGFEQAPPGSCAVSTDVRQVVEARAGCSGEEAARAGSSSPSGTVPPAAAEAAWNGQAPSSPDADQGMAAAGAGWGEGFPLPDPSSPDADQGYAAARAASDHGYATPLCSRPDAGQGCAAAEAAWGGGEATPVPSSSDAGRGCAAAEADWDVGASAPCPSSPDADQGLAPPEAGCEGPIASMPPGIPTADQGDAAAQAGSQPGADTERSAGSLSADEAPLADSDVGNSSGCMRSSTALCGTGVAESSKGDLPPGDPPPPSLAGSNVCAAGSSKGDMPLGDVPSPSQGSDRNVMGLPGSRKGADVPKGLLKSTFHGGAPSFDLGL